MSPCRIDFLYLSRQDVEAAGVGVREAVATAEEVLLECSTGRMENPPKPGIHPMPDAFIHAMPGYLPGLEVAGMKWVSGFSSNPAHGLPAVLGLLVLNDVRTGQPLSVMDCSWITEIRTAAVSAVAARYLARRDASVVGLVGAGVQGRAHALCLPVALPRLRVLRVFDTDSRALQAFQAELGGSVPFEIQAVPSVRAALEGADVVITATGKLSQPIFRLDWTPEGALILPVHSGGWEKRAPFRVEKFVVDCWEQFRHAQEGSGGYYGALPAPYAELGAVVAGRAPGRENDNERILDHNYGMAVQDIALGLKILQAAESRGLGTRVPLMEIKKEA